MDLRYFEFFMNSVVSSFSEPGKKKKNKHNPLLWSAFYLYPRLLKNNKVQTWLTL
jgi:hypothetical protein